MNRFLTPLLLLSSALLAGCAGPHAGSDDTTYYYSNRNATGAIPTVHIAPVEPVLVAGPGNLSRLVYFDFDSAVVRQADRSTVMAHAAHLNRKRSANVVLEGSTDARGGREYNLALGQRRAEAVKAALVLLGAADGQLEAISWGMEKPASTGQTERAYQLNRRVEFRYR